MTDRSRTQAKLHADVFLDAGRNGGVGANSAGDGADGDVVYSGIQASAGATQLVHPHGELEAEGGRLGMDAVGAAHHEGVPVSDGRLGDGFMQRVQSGAQERPSFDELDGKGGIQHV